MLTTGPLTQAEIISWDESIVTDCGRGFNPRRPAQFSEPRPIVALLGTPTIAGSSGASFESRYARSKEDIARFLSVNLAASVSSLAYSADLKTSFTDSFSSSEDTVTFVVNARRDFGRISYPSFGMTENFTNEVNLMRKSSQGSSLYQAISNRFGSHFISGYQSAARLAVMYKFSFASRSQARQFRSKFEGSSGVVDVTAEGVSALSQNNSTVSIEFHLNTLGRGAPPKLWPTNVIKSPEDFLLFGKKVQDYWHGLNETNGVPTEYIAEPIENLPGFTALLDGYSPSNRWNSPYERFMTAYGNLKACHSDLVFWSGSDNRMSWMNSSGRIMVRNLEAEVSQELASLEAKARAYFERGTDLVVEDSSLKLRQKFDRIPRPQFGNLVVTDFDGVPHTFGYVLCGDKDLVLDRPFSSVSVIVNGQPAYTDILRTMEEWESTSSGRTSHSPTFVEWGRHIITTPQWEALKRSKSRVVIYFIGNLRNQAWGELSKVSLAVKDKDNRIVESTGILNPDRPMPLE